MRSPATSQCAAISRSSSRTRSQWEAVRAALAALAIDELQEYRPAEIFRDAKGKAVPAGHYSMLVSTTFQSPNRTLRDEELHAWSNNIVSTLESLGGKLRA